MTWTSRFFKPSQMTLVYSNMGERPSKTEGRRLETSYRDLSTAGENSLISQAKPASIHPPLTFTCGFHVKQVFVACFCNEHVFVYRALVSCLGQHPPCHCSVAPSCRTLRPHGLLHASIHRVEFEEVSGHRVLIKRGPGNRGPSECGTTHEATSGMSS